MTPKELFVNNQKLVGWCFKKYIGEYNALDMDDIMQEGMLGLWQACNRFDESKGYKFTTFAVSYIFGGMKRYMRERRNLIRLPRKAIDNDLELHTLLTNISSLDAEVSSDVEGVTLGDILSAPPDSYESLTEDLIEGFLSTIENTTHRDLMEEYYYTTTWAEPPTQYELMEKYKMSQPQVSRLIKKYNQAFIEFIDG